MTNKEFKRWRKSQFPTQLACAEALEWDRDKVKALETGKTRLGAPYPVRTCDALACAAWTVGLRRYHGEPESEIIIPQPTD